MTALVYLAAPYTLPDPVENTHEVIRTADRLLDFDGITPVVPHLTMLWHFVCPRPYEKWLAYDRELLRRCDAVLRLPGASRGADIEVELAHELGIDVFFSQDALIKWVRARARSGGRTPCGLVSGQEKP